VASRAAYRRRSGFAARHPGKARGYPHVAQFIPILFPPDQSTAARTWLTAIASQPGVTAQDFTVSAATKAAQKIATHHLWLGRGDGTYGRLSALAARTLVAYGADDVVVPPANAQILLRRIPHATSLRIGDAGHAFLFQDPPRAARAFTAFLRSTA
jgi:pimeloyl-ACP methyl ester carboxylesterase